MWSKHRRIAIVRILGLCCDADVAVEAALGGQKPSCPAASEFRI